MNRITKQIWIGNDKDAKYEKEQLKKNGITAILNVALDLTNNHLNHKEFVLCHCGLDDTENNKLEALISAVYQLINLIKNNHVILAHCRAGQSRSVLTTAYTLYRLGEFPTFDLALDYVRDKRHGTGENQGLKKLFLELNRVQFVLFEND